MVRNCQRWAVTLDGDEIHVNNSKKSDKYFCIGQECHELVFPKKGEHRIWHFSHYKDTECGMNIKKYNKKNEDLEIIENPTYDEEKVNPVCNKVITEPYVPHYYDMKLDREEINKGYDSDDFFTNWAGRCFDCKKKEDKCICKKEKNE